MLPGGRTEERRVGLLSGYLGAARIARVAPHVRGDLLDIGCQSGQLRAALGDRIAGYAGIDISEGAVAAARAAHPDARFWVANIDDGLPEIAERFDTIVLCAVVEHLFNLKLAFSGLRGLLKPEGRMVLTTPTVFGNDVVHGIGARLGLFAQAAQDDHIVIFNRQRFRVLAAEVGLELERHELFQFGCNQLAVLRRPG